MTSPPGGAAYRLDLLDDAALAATASSGDRAALDCLLRRHYERLATLCRRLCGNDADGADATQEAMIAIVRGLTNFDGRSSFSTWSYRVATNACLDELRRRSRRALPGLDEDVPVLQARMVQSSDDDQVADRLDIDAALARLSPEFRAVVVLRDLAGFDYADIAQQLDIPPGTVRSRIARGRAALAEMLRNRAPSGNVQSHDHEL